MTKSHIIIVMLAMIFLTVHPVFAQSGIGEVYVDTNYIGGEDGTQSHPYNTVAEGKAMAQAQPNGAWLYTKQPEGSWVKIYIPPIGAPATGGDGYVIINTPLPSGVTVTPLPVTPLPSVSTVTYPFDGIFYAFLAVLMLGFLGLILIGWQFQRRSRQLKG
jgi:hypothetical protein